MKNNTVFWAISCESIEGPISFHVMVRSGLFETKEEAVRLMQYLQADCPDITYRVCKIDVSEAKVGKPTQTAYIRDGLLYSNSTIAVRDPEQALLN